MAKISYTEEHQWISITDNLGTVGISDYAQVQLGDIVFVELPEVGINVFKGQEVAVVESVKIASGVYSPVDGEIVEVNKILEADPSIVNSDAEGNGWIYKIRISDYSNVEGLMSELKYKEFVKN